VVQAEAHSATATERSLEDIRMSGQGSTGNVIAALASFFIPGLGQLIQGRLMMAIIQFVLAGILWIFLLGWLIHLWSIIDAALWKPKAGLA
jgi:TM2 domain-containing membrane protein YozV